MSSSKRNVPKGPKITCSRCDRLARATKAKGWNVTFNRGIVAGHLCPDCQSVQENMEAEINEATIDYRTLREGPFGRMIVAPKGGGTDA